MVIFWGKLQRKGSYAVGCPFFIILCGESENAEKGFLDRQSLLYHPLREYRCDCTSYNGLRNNLINKKKGGICNCFRGDGKTQPAGGSLLYHIYNRHVATAAKLERGVGYIRSFDPVLDTHLIVPSDDAAGA